MDRIFAEWAGWRVVSNDEVADGFMVLNPRGDIVSTGRGEGCQNRQRAESIIWSTAIGFHDDLRVADPVRYAYWLADDLRDEALMMLASREVAT